MAQAAQPSTSSTIRLTLWVSHLDRIPDIFFMN